MLSGILSPNVVSNDFFASEDEKSLPLIRDNTVLASLSNFRGDRPRTVACGVPDITSTRSRIFVTFSLVTGPSIVMECLTPSLS